MTKTSHYPSEIERFEQAMIDADIEGLAQDPEAVALVTQWRAEGVDIETRIHRLKQHYRDRRSVPAR